MKMSRLQSLKDSFKQRLITAADDHLLPSFHDILLDYKRETERKRILLETVAKRPGVQQLLVIKNTAEQQECSSCMNQGGQELNLIKEEEEDEAIDKIKEEDSTQFCLTSVDVKGEYDETTSSLTHHMKTEADGDNKELTSFLDTPLHDDHQRPLCSESDTDDSEDWGETSNTSGSNVVENPKVHVSEKKDDALHKSLICSECGKKCSSKAGLTLHLKYCCGKSFASSYHGKTFEKAQTLKGHERINTEEKPFVCSECGKSFTRNEHLKGHTRIHTGEKPFTCSQCGKCFAERGRLTSHLRIHTGEKPFVCSQCGCCFRWGHQLKSHMRFHTGEKPFSCLQCGKCFSERGRLSSHLRIHSGEKPFSCSECDKRYMERRNLKRHLRSHSGEKPFICSQCDKCFAQRKTLDEHLRIHTGQKTFTAYQCGKWFTCEQKLTSHMKSHLSSALCDHDYIAFEKAEVLP